MVLVPVNILHAGDFKRLVLIILLIFISKYFDKDLKIKLHKMYGNFNFKNFVWSFFGVFIYLFLFSCLTARKICSFNFSNRSLQNCISLFILSVFEEMFFRGWAYTAFLSVLDRPNSGPQKINIGKFSIILSECMTVVLTNLFFAIFHLQTYIIIYNYNFMQTVGTFISVFGVGIFFTLIFVKTKSIWNVILIHFLWDYILGVIC